MELFFSSYILRCVISFSLIQENNALDYQGELKIFLTLEYFFSHSTFKVSLI